MIDNNFKNIPTILPKGYMLDTLKEYYKNGFPTGYYTGIDCLDNICRLDLGQLLTVTGYSNSGKSEFVDFLTTTLQKKYGLKTLYFSPENQPYAYHYYKLIKKYKSRLKNEAEVEAAAAFIDDNYFFYNYDKITHLNDIISEAETVIRQKGVNILVIDAYNKIECDIGNGEIETNFISKVMDRLVNFAHQHNVLVILVAHPTKPSADESKPPTKYNICGSANFANKSDFVIVVHRDRAAGNVRIIFDKVRFSNYGSCGECRLKYDTPSGNYYEESDEFAYSEDNFPEYIQEPFEFPNVTKADPLDVEVSLYRGAIDKMGEVVKLADCLQNTKYKDIVDKVRAGKTPEERHSIKDAIKSQIPCFTIGGTFEKRGKDNLTKASGLIGIDIDFKDNTEVISQVPEVLKRLPYILYSAKSVSGDGYFAIVRLGTPENYKGHFNALERDFKKLGITIDKSCKDISRLRFVSYDTDAYYNREAKLYYSVLGADKKKEENQGCVEITRTSYPSCTSTSTLESIDNLVKQWEDAGSPQLDDTYDGWRNLGMSICSEFGEGGRALYHKLSASSSKYDIAGTDKQYDYILEHYSGNNQFSIGTAIRQIKESIS